MMEWIPSQRDRAILARLAAGATDDEIARALNYSARTVQNAQARMRAVTGQPNRAALAAWAARHGYDRGESA